MIFFVLAHFYDKTIKHAAECNKLRPVLWEVLRGIMGCVGRQDKKG